MIPETYSTEGLIFENMAPLGQGEGAVASGRIDAGAEYFRDHFPEFPVLPGVMALEIIKRTADFCIASRDGARARARLCELRQAKFSGFLKPGDAWECRVELVSRSDSGSVWKAQLAQDGKTAVSARAVLEA